MKLGSAVSAGAVALKNGLLAGNLLSLTMIADPRKMVSYWGESFFLYKHVSRRRGIPARHVYDVLHGDQEQAIVLGKLSNGGNAYWNQSPSNLVDLVSLCLICRITRPSAVFEIGTRWGLSALHFALNTAESTPIYTLDLPKHGPASTKLRTTLVDDRVIESYRATKEEYYFARCKERERIHTLFGDSATFDYRPYLGAVDFFFIDGAHSYEYVRSDSENALRCCKPGAVIAWHDFGRAGVNGVSRYLIELSRTREIFAAPGGSLAYMVVQ